MFEELLLGSAPQRGIALETHRGTPIKNEIAIHPIPEHAMAKFERLSRQHPRWQLRKPPTGIYNCVGMVWASRRTAVYDQFDEVILRIRDDDGYRVLELNQEQPVAGDVACYWERVNPYRGCYHVGIVVWVQKRDRLPELVYVLSKWDDTAGEVFHEATDVPKSFGNARLEYWTDRPILGRVAS